MAVGFYVLRVSLSFGLSSSFQGVWRVVRAVLLFVFCGWCFCVLRSKLSGNVMLAKVLHWCQFYVRVCLASEWF